MRQMQEKAFFVPRSDIWILVVSYVAVTALRSEKRRLLDQRLVIAGSGEQLLDLDVLVLGVGQGGVSGAEADGGDAGGVGVAAVCGEGPEAGAVMLERASEDWAFRCYLDMGPLCGLWEGNP